MSKVVLVFSTLALGVLLGACGGGGAASGVTSPPTSMPSPTATATPVPFAPGPITVVFGSATKQPYCLSYEISVSMRSEPCNLQVNGGDRIAGTLGFYTALDGTTGKQSANVQPTANGGAVVFATALNKPGDKFTVYFTDVQQNKSPTLTYTVVN